MPSKSERQRRFMAADLARAQKGQRTTTGMSPQQLKDFARKPLARTRTRKAPRGDT